VNDKLNIEIEWERLDAGAREERSAFAAIGIQFGNIWLTEAEDIFVKRIRQKVHLSGYRLAEWLAWNWWRLRWEPRRNSLDWAMAHRTATIGGGYVWPDITIVSDGERIVLNTLQTAARPSEPLRYICQIPAIVRAAVYEDAVVSFVESVVGKLRVDGIERTNLQLAWGDVLAERADPKMAEYRKFEALMGFGADEAEASVIERLVRDAGELGQSGVEELAAARVGSMEPATSAQIKEIAIRNGIEASPRDAVRIQNAGALPSNVEAWKRGVAVAKSLRDQERLGIEPISNDRLCQLSGVSSKALQPSNKSDFFSFSLDEKPTKGFLVLRSRYQTGRRFDLARLLGDRIAAPGGGTLKPATRTYTYRQKLQRAFAGEFLCPFDALADRLKGDFTDEAIEEAANYFNVSVLTVRTLLVNHKMIERESLQDDFGLAAA
jgi:Zn-dependent peptidase ImmA (M78 family)